MKTFVSKLDISNLMQVNVKTYSSRSLIANSTVRTFVIFLIPLSVKVFDAIVIFQHTKGVVCSNLNN